MASVADDADAYILDCYRLAWQYHLHPQAVLDMPMSQVKLHMYWTIRLADVRQQAQLRARQEREEE